MSSNALTLYDASAPILSERFHTATSFPQSGSWSWVQLIDTGVKGALSVLSRYSAAGVDPFTIIVGQVICSNFQLSVPGKQRLLKTIEKLSSMNSIGNILHIGFGVDSVVRNLATTEEGAILAAICSAAVECYEMNHAANIMWQLSRTFKAPERQTPSSLQWKSLIKVCAGTLARTEFSALAEQLMRLGDRSDRLPTGRYLPGRDRGVSSPESLAEAMIGIGKVSTGELVSITITGGSDAGWLAALAQWVFDLSIELFDSNGHLLHRNFGNHKRAQVRFFYGSTNSTSSTELVTKERIYKLRDITDLVSLEGGEYGPMLVCGRVSWETALKSTFGSSFKRLLEMQRVFSKFILAASEIFHCFFRADPQLGREKEFCQTYFESSHGTGFTSFILALFPELAVLGDAIRSSKPESFDTAIEMYESSRASLKAGCLCSLCKNCVDDGRNFCLVVIADTIIDITYVMTGISVPQDLHPMRSGIEGFYRRRAKFYEWKEVTTVVHPIFDIAAPQSSNHSAVRRVLCASRLFSGRLVECKSAGERTTAIGVSGIVVALECILSAGFKIDPENVGRCRVLNGQIEMHGRPYSAISDMSDFDFSGIDLRAERGEFGPAKLEHPTQLKDDYVDVDLVARDEFEVLKAGLLFKTSHDSNSIILGPAYLTSRILSTMGLIYCDHKMDATGSSKSLTIKDLDSDKCVFPLPDSREPEKKTWLFQGNRASRIVALMASREILPLYHQVFRQHECLTCCAEAANRSPEECSIIIWPKQARQGVM